MQAVAAECPRRGHGGLSGEQEVAEVVERRGRPLQAGAIMIGQRGFSQGDWSWSGWQSLGGGITSRPVAAVRGVGIGADVDVFVRGVDGGVYRRHRPPWQGYWEGYEGLGGYIQGAPAVVAISNQLMLFGRGSDNGLYVNRFDGSTWSGWQGLGGSLTSDPVAVVRGSVVDVFARSAGGDVVYQRWNGSFWEGWVSLGGWIEGNIDAVATRTNLIFVFARAGLTAWVNRFDGSWWSGWQSLGEAVVSDPSAGSWSNPPYSRVYVAYRGTNDQLYAQGWNSETGAWTGWHGNGGGVTLPPALTSGIHAMLASDKDNGTVYWRQFQPWW